MRDKLDLLLKRFFEPHPCGPACGVLDGPDDEDGEEENEEEDEEDDEEDEESPGQPPPGSKDPRRRDLPHVSTHLLDK